MADAEVRADMVRRAQKDLSYRADSKKALIELIDAANHAKSYLDKVAKTGAADAAYRLGQAIRGSAIIPR